MSSPEDTPPPSSSADSALGEAAPARRFGSDHDGAASGPKPRASFVGSDPPPSEQDGGKLGRWAFYAIWMGAVPFALAVGNVWLLTPGPGSAAGPLQAFVAEQKIPAGIVLFTIFAMVLYRFRHDLPFAKAIGVGGRRDVPASVRSRYEDAAGLLDESRAILRAHRREVERELTAAEREQVIGALAALERAMAAERFDAPEFEAAYMRADRIVGEHLTRWRKGEMREYAESIGIAVAVALLLRAFVVEAFKIPSGSMIPTLMVGDHIFVNKFTYGPLIPWTDKRLFNRLPPERADVMVFKFPENKDQDFIKRVIATPGDTLEAINGRPVINGWLVPHCEVGRFNYEAHEARLFVEYLGERTYFTLFNGNPDEFKCDGDDCHDALAKAYRRHYGGQRDNPVPPDLGMDGTNYMVACRGGICGLRQGEYNAAAGEVWVMGDNRDNSHDSRSWRGGLGAGVPLENIKGRAMFVWMSFGPGDGIAQDRLFVSVMGTPKLPASHEHELAPAVDKCLRERPPVSQTTPPPPRNKR